MPQLPLVLAQVLQIWLLAGTEVLRQSGLIDRETPRCAQTCPRISDIREAIEVTCTPAVRHEERVEASTEIEEEIGDYTWWLKLVICNLSSSLVIRILSCCPRRVRHVARDERPEGREEFAIYRAPEGLRGARRRGGGVLE